MSKQTTKTSFLRRKSVWAVIALIIASYFAYKHFTKPAVVAAPVLTEAVTKRDISRSITLSGKVQPSVTVDVGTQASGQIEQVHVVVGQRVKRGDLLVTLDPSIARNDVQQAQANVDQTSAQLDAKQIDLEQSRKEAARQQRLFEGDAVTRNELENAQTALRRLETDIRMQTASLNKQAADLAKAKLRLSQTQVFAPREGEVLNIALQAGQTVTATQSTPTLLTLANLDTVNIQAQIAEADVLRIKVGQEAELTSAADRNKTYKAIVKRLQPPARSSATASRNESVVFYGVTLEAQNTDGKLLSEMSTQALITVAGVKDVLTVPLLAVGERDNNGSFAVQVMSDADASAGVSASSNASANSKANKGVERKVRLGMNDTKFVEVVSGLKLGEKVIVQRPEDAFEKKRKNDF
jgi:membrane fusion protein, macrolide-specific efflux system